MHYGWWKSSDNGAAVTGYTTQVRCYRDGRYRAWTTRTSDASTYYYNHRGLTGYATCQVRVRAENAHGRQRLVDDEHHREVALTRPTRRRALDRVGG